MSTEEVAALVARLSELEARALTNEIKTKQTEMWVLLGRAYAGRAWEALGYAPGAKGWADYCAKEFGDVGQYALKPAARREIVKVWMLEHGMTQGAVATGMGVSKGTTNNDVQVLTEAGELDDLPDNVVALDGRRRSTASATTAKAETGGKEPSCREVALTLLRKAGAKGLTSTELSRKAKWDDRPGLASGTLSKMAKGGLAKQTETRRNNRSTYIVVD